MNRSKFPSRLPKPMFNQLMETDNSKGERKRKPNLGWEVVGSADRIKLIERSPGGGGGDDDEGARLGEAQPRDGEVMELPPGNDHWQRRGKRRRRRGTRPREEQSPGEERGDGRHNLPTSTLSPISIASFFGFLGFELGRFRVTNIIIILVRSPARWIWIGCFTRYRTWTKRLILTISVFSMGFISTAHFSKEHVEGLNTTSRLIFLR